MKVYRAHVDILQPDQLVPPSTTFFEKLTPKKKAVEELLESVRPCDSPKRDSAIYLFEDELKARKWASVQRPARRLYLVEAKQNELKVDWCWLQKIENEMERDCSSAKEMARKYWASQATNDPCWELLATSAIVKKEIDIPILERNRFIEQKLADPNF